MDLHEFRMKTMLREILAIQIYESHVRTEPEKADYPSWRQLDRKQQDIWRTRGSMMIDSEVSR